MEDGLTSHRIHALFFRILIKWQRYIWHLASSGAVFLEGETIIHTNQELKTKILKSTRGACEVLDIMLE